jgi:hypothetical protein
MKRSLALLYLIISPLLLLSQNPEEKKFGIQFNGFVKTDLIWDSRQTMDLREGHFLLYPLNESLDPEGNDINAQSSFNFLSIQTRLRGDITGPDALGARTSGAIEGEFFGMANADINGFRLRHAYVKLNWPKTELMVGQYWHPLFTTNCYPEVVSFNTGAPFLPFTRNPQIRVTQDLGKIRIIAAALSQIDFKSTGPEGPNVKYLRNTALPIFTLNLEYSTKNETSGISYLAGVAGSFKMLMPQTKTDSLFKTNTTVSSMVGIVYFKLGLPKVTFKLSGLYGQDVFDFTMVGGYAVSEIKDPSHDYREYVPLKTMSAWAEVMTTGKKMQGGLFLAISKNLGAGEDISGPYYHRDKNIDYLYRISPRFIYNAGKFRIAPEIEYTVAAYGKTDTDGSVTDSKEIGNFRFLTGVYFFF